MTFEGEIPGMVPLAALVVIARVDVARKRHVVESLPDAHVAQQPDDRGQAQAE
jgi:hypothetical protein